MVPDFAIIIPTYNRAAYIAMALDSVLAQTVLTRGATLEIAVVDDGSTDATAATLEPYLQRHGQPGGAVHLTYTRLQKQGVVTARNTALAATTAPLVAFLDSDDYWAPAKLEKQTALLAADESVGVVHTSFRYVDAQSFLRGDPGPRGERPDNPIHGACVRQLLQEDLVIFSSVLMRRDIIAAAAAAEVHGLPFDPRWTNAQDYDLLLRAARLSTYAYVPEPLVYYRLHDQHGAMGNLPRAFGFHSRVQLDFVERWGRELGLTTDDARACVREFLLGRATGLFWQRQLATTRALCDLATELDVADARFTKLRRKAGRPAWLYRVKDWVDRKMR